MCGIAGFFSPNSQVSREELRAMGAKLSHRGPDADGFFEEGPVGLVHRRLRILDLSQASDQPMLSQSQNYVIAFNGEVYNYKELAQEHSLEMRTSSDTEVVLELLSRKGNTAITEFNGMFAIALYNRNRQELTLIRDRMGIKPIYYFWDGRVFVFASEMKALLSCEAVRKGIAISTDALNYYLHLGYIPQPHTIYRNIHKLPAGSIVTINKSGIDISKYWDLPSLMTESCIDDEIVAKENLKDLVEESVRLRLRADVPFGVFLSGGIDSSLVAAVAQRNVSTRLKTFSIGFADAKHDESKYARDVATYLGTDHHERIVTEKEALELIPEMLDVYDEPYADSSAIPTMLVSKIAREEVTMVLTGDGGDELFLGYGAYEWAERLTNPALKLVRKPLAMMLGQFSSRYKRIANVLDFKDEQTRASHIFSQEQYCFSRSELVKTINPLYHRDMVLNEIFGSLPRELTPHEQQALFDLHYYLTDDLLVKVDRASMKYALEARVPLLDFNIVQYAMNISPDLKIRNGVQKHILKELLYDYVPYELFQRPKWGFSIPLSRWLNGSLSFLVDEYLNEQSVRSAGLVHAGVVKTIVAAYGSGKCDYLYNRIWLLIVLHKFMKEKAVTASID